MLEFLHIYCTYAKYPCYAHTSVCRGSILVPQCTYTDVYVYFYLHNVFCTLLVQETYTRGILYTPEHWKFHSSNTSCNSVNDIHHENTSVVHILPGVSPSTTPNPCKLQVKLLDKSGAGAYILLDGSISCGNTVDILGLCGSKTCEEVSHNNIS